MNWNKTSTIISCITGAILLGGTVFNIDRHFARASEVRGLAKKIEYTNQRIERKIKEDQLYNTRSRKWKIEDRLEEKGTDATLSNELNELRHLESLLEADLQIEGNK